HSEHNYRGGPHLRSSSFGGQAPGHSSSGSGAPARSSARAKMTQAFPTVSDRERTGPPMTADGADDLELMLRRVIREETGITPVAPAEKWRGGTLVLKPGTPGLQEKTWPIETFFHKV